MLLNFSELFKKYSIKTKGVVVVGSHWGEEYDDYVKNGIQYMVFIEPCEKAFNELKDRFSNNDAVVLVNSACSDYFGRGTMYTGDNAVNQGQSNSLLRPDKHLILHPTVEFDAEEEVSVDTLTNILSRTFVTKSWPEEFKLLVMDVQGTEGSVIRGAMGVLRNFDYVYTEINFGSVYENCTLAEELDLLLHDFRRVETGPKVGGLWSDCFYVRKSLLHD